MTAERPVFGPVWAEELVLMVFFVGSLSKADVSIGFWDGLEGLLKQVSTVGSPRGVRHARR